MIEIDSQADDENQIPVSFRWSTDGGINFNQSGIEALTATGIHSQVLG